MTATETGYHRIFQGERARAGSGPHRFDRSRRGPARRAGTGLVRPLSPLLTRWFPAIATTTERLGQAMINVAANGYPTPVLESRAINLTSKAGHNR